jgi:O-antigen/teichoic acid export membrane protein
MSGIPGQAATVVFARGITRVSQLVAFVILARFLTPSEFGWFGIVTTAIVLATLLGSLGLRQSFAYQIGQGNLKPGEAVVTSILVWPLLTVASSGVLVIIFSSESPLSPFWTITLIVVGVAASLLVNLLQGVNLGRGEIPAFSLTENLPRTLLMVGTILLALFGALNLFSALWAQILGFVATLPVALWLATRKTGWGRPQIRQLPSMVAYGSIFALNLFLLMLSARLSMFVIENVQGAESAGQFFAAVRVNEIFLEVATALGMVLFSNAARQSDKSSTLARNVRISCWLLWLFLIGSVFVVAMAPLLVRVLAGNQYAEAIPALQVLAIGLGPAAAAKVIYPTLAGTGRPFFGTPLIFVSLAINAVLAFLLIPQMGLVGGAIGLVVGQFILFAGYVVACRVRFNIPVRDFLLPRSSDVSAVAHGVHARMSRLLDRSAAVFRPRRSPHESD